MSDGLLTPIDRPDAAVPLRDPERITQRIESELQDATRARTVALPDRFRQVRADGDTRRLPHHSDALGCTAVAMTWTACHVLDEAGVVGFVLGERSLSHHQ